MASERLIYVNTDVVGGAGDGTSLANAYATLGAMWTGEAGSLVTADEWLKVLLYATGGTAQTARADAWLGSGEMTDATRYIRIEASVDDRATPAGIDTDKFRLDVATFGIVIYEDYVQIDGIQSTCTSASLSTGDLPGADTNNAIVITNCYLTGADIPLYNNNSVGTTNITVNNCVIQGYFRAYTACVGLFYNNNFYHATYVWYLAAGTLTFKNNNFAGGSSTVEDGTATLTVQDNCADFDLDTQYTESSNVAPSGSDWTNEMTAPSTGDWTRLGSGNGYDTGIGPSSDANVPTPDMDGSTRSGTTCDMGADEYVAAGGANAPTGTLYGALYGPLAGPIGG